MDKNGVEQSRLKNSFIAVLSHSVCCGIMLCYIVIFSNLMLTAANEQLALNYLACLSVGITLMNLGYAGYCHFHPSEKPHSPLVALLYMLFYGLVWLFYRPFKKR